MHFVHQRCARSRAFPPLMIFNSFFGDFTMTSVVVLTHKDDPHASAVTDYFDLRGVEYLRIDTDRIIDELGFSFSSEGFLLHTLDRMLLLSPDWNIWNRRVMDPSLPKDFPKELENIVFTETKRSWQSLLFSHQGKVINRPQNEFAANNKIDQLLYARSNPFGVKIPDTLLTNDPALFRAFYAVHEQVSHKLQKAALVSRGDDYLTTYNNIVSAEQAGNADLLRMHPALFQEYIDKNYELRITVTEAEVVAVRINSQDSPLSIQDFRRYDFDDVEYSHIELPDRVCVFCKDLINHYGLSFGAIDMIYSDKGEYVFLELNPNGQWLWLQEQSGHDLTSIVAENLL